MVRLSVPSLLLVLVGASVAVAESNQPPGGPAPTPDARGPRIVVTTPLEMYATPHAPQISGTLYLERCVGNCAVKQGPNDARTMSSSIPRNAGESTILEFRGGDADKDAIWNALMQCMREVYSPFNVTVTDQKPLTGISYHMAIVAGNPGNIGYGTDILGVAPLASDCSPQDNVISFSFANAHPQTGDALVKNLCWTAAQESAHAFGLDHQYEFIGTGRSACNDPMTYRVDCGGQKFFRNENSRCGEYNARECRCGPSQNSHLKLLTVFEGGQSIVPAPTVEITTPTASTTALGTVVIASAGSKRGVAKAELFLNGFKWAEVGGAAFTGDGQPVPSPYTLQVPATVPNSIIDIKVRAYDDLNNFTDSPVVTVTKGAACASADTCAAGQKCENGRCFWDPPAGEIGESCTYPQFCLSGRCEGSDGDQICTQECIPGVEDSCPTDLSCEEVSTGRGVCVLGGDGGGCCSTSRGRSPWAAIAFAALTLGLLIRPWRRRR